MESKVASGEWKRNLKLTFRNTRARKNNWNEKAKNEDNAGELNMLQSLLKLDLLSKKHLLTTSALHSPSKCYKGCGKEKDEEGELKNMETLKGVYVKRVRDLNFIFQKGLNINFLREKWKEKNLMKKSRVSRHLTKAQRKAYAVYVVAQNIRINCRNGF